VGRRVDLLPIGSGCAILEPVTSFPPFHARPLDAASLPEARELATAAGAHGVNVVNALA
jgi:hypothetical protein